MDLAQARESIREVFTQSFDKEQYRLFIRNLLNELDESDDRQTLWTHQYVKDAYKPGVDKFERLATYADENGDKIDILIVYLKKETGIHRARTFQRNFIADYLTRGHGDNKEAVLAAFVSTDSTDWRFSLIRLEYVSEQNEKGVVAAREKLTPARRYSFLVGSNESSHTAQSQLVGILSDTENNPTLAQLEEAFNVERVTKEFFDCYKTLVFNFQEEVERIAKKDKVVASEFKAKKINTLDFAKKLMGQIVFLYFIQKKGWLGVKKGADWGTGPQNFLRQLFTGGYGEYENFFNDILEHLFYDTLATDRGHDAWCKHFKCRIPFLNGGLFEPLDDYDWEKTEIIIPNDLFSNDEKSKQGDTGTGILDVFDRYNFTVNEAEPLEKEVAIDPEMLGKVFEELLGVSERKSKGSFYTPREIVHYMCQESLVNYLDTSINTKQKALVPEKAKQMSMLAAPEPEQGTLQTQVYEEIVPRTDIETLIHLGERASDFEAARKSGTKSYSAKLPKSLEKNARLIDEKLRDITVCDPAIGSGAFPVGMMTEIVRARSTLTPYFNDISERTPYHFKRHAIQDCLYGVDIDPGAVEIAKLRLWLSLVVDEEDVKQIKPLPNLDYKIVSGNSLLGVEKDLFNLDAYNQLEALKPRFFDETDHDKKAVIKTDIEKLIHELTSGKDIFDFEIYFSEVFHRKQGFDVVIANPPYGANIDESLPVLRPIYKDAIRNYAEIYKMFMQLGLRKLCQHGIQVFITPNTFLAQSRYKDIRAILLQHQIVHIVNLGEEVFESVVVPTCISFVKRADPNPVYRLADLSKANKYAGIMQGIVFRDITLQRVKNAKDLSLYYGRELRENEVTFDDALEIRDAGIQYHRSGIGLKNKGGNDLYDRLFGDTPNAFSATKQVWYGKLIDKWIIRQDTDEYFNLDYKDVLKSNESASFREVAFNVSPKILWRQTASCLRAVIDTEKRWFRNTIQCAFIRDTYAQQLDIYYVLGVVNSKYIEHEYNNLVRESGRVFPQVKITHVKKLPLPIPDKSKQEQIGTLAKRILSEKAKTISADIADAEDKLNRLVYKLYGLTKEEIAIVEGNS